MVRAQDAYPPKADGSKILNINKIVWRGSSDG